MTSIKTAISLEESLFKQAEDLARELQIPRSHLYALAVAEEPDFSAGTAM